MNPKAYPLADAQVNRVKDGINITFVGLDTAGEAVSRPHDLLAP